MSVTILPMRKIVIASGSDEDFTVYQVWEGNKCILQTMILEEAKEKAGEIE